MCYSSAVVSQFHAPDSKSVCKRERERGGKQLENTQGIYYIIKNYEQTLISTGPADSTERSRYSVK